MEKRISFLFVFILSVTNTVNANTTTIPDVVIKKPPSTILTNTSTIKTRISQYDMQQSGVTSLSEALRNLGGVQLQDLAGNNSQVLLGLRGFGANASSNTLMLLNGIPITNPDMAPPDLNAIPINEIETIEIIAGSESVLYGDQAVGGVINIITHDKAKQKAEINCGAGSYTAKNCSLTVRSLHDQAKLTLNVGGNHTDNYRDHSDYDQGHLFARFAYFYPKGKINIDVNLSKELMQYPGALTATQVREDRRQATNDSDYFKDWNNYIHIRQRQYLNDDWQLQTDLARRSMQGNGFLSVPFDQARTVYYLKPQLTGKIYQQTLNSGIDLQEDEYRNVNSMFGTTNNKQQQAGAFALLNITSLPKNTISLGLRGALQTSHLRSYTNNDNVNRAIASTIGTTYTYTPTINFYLRRAESFRFPKADENAMVPMGVNGLRTQRGVAYETGVNRTEQNYHYTLGLYQLNLKDEIAFDPTQTPTEPFGSNRNLAPTKRLGFSLSGRRQLLPALSVDGQYNYVNARYQSGVNAGNRIPLVSESIIRSGLLFQFNEQWSSYLESVFTGNQYPANDDANISGTIGGYTIYNVNLRYVWRDFSATFHINNLTSKAYYFYTVYQSGMVPSEFFYPAPERNVMLTLNYVFT